MSIIKKIILVLVGSLFFASCSNYFDDGTKVIYKDGTPNMSTEDFVSSITSNISDVLTNNIYYVIGEKGMKRNDRVCKNPDGTPNGKKGCKSRHRKQKSDITKKYHIYKEEFKVIQSSNTMTVYANKKEFGPRPLFITGMPKKASELSCAVKVPVKEFLTLAKEMLLMQRANLMQNLGDVGYVAPATIKTICSFREKNNMPFLCKYPDDVESGNIKLTIVNIDSDTAIAKVNISRGFYVCKDFVKPSEAMGKRLADNIAVFKIVVGTE